VKLIIAGTRTFSVDHHTMKMHLDNFKLQPAMVLSGGARGIDESGENWALRNGIPVMRVNADWDKHGRAAGPIRNRRMAELADSLLLIWDGKSPGSRNMKSEMEKLNKPVCEVRL